MNNRSVYNALVLLFFLNATITATHYALISAGMIPISGSFQSMREFAIADYVAVVIPSFFATYGLWKLKAWGLPLSLVASGGYIHGLIVLLYRAVSTSDFNAMSFVSLYFIAFSVFLTAYLWKHRAILVQSDGVKGSGEIAQIQ